MRNNSAATGKHRPADRSFCCPRSGISERYPHIPPSCPAPSVHSPAFRGRATKSYHPEEQPPQTRRLTRPWRRSPPDTAGTDSRLPGTSLPLPPARPTLRPRSAWQAGRILRKSSRLDCRPGRFQNPCRPLHRPVFPTLLSDMCSSRPRSIPSRGRCSHSKNRNAGRI